MMYWKRFFGLNWYKVFGFLVIAYFTYQSYVFDAVVRGFPFPYYTAEGFCPPGGCPPGTFSFGLLVLDIVLWYLALNLCFYFTLFNTSESRLKNFFVHAGNFLIGTIASVLVLALLFILLPSWVRMLYTNYINPPPPRMAIPIT